MRTFFNRISAQVKSGIAKATAFFSSFVNKLVVKDEYRRSDLSFHLAPQVKSGTTHGKTVSDGSDVAIYSVDNLSDGTHFNFALDIISDNKKYHSEVKAEVAEAGRLKITSFVFNNKPEKMLTRKETFNALNEISNQLRRMELSGRMPEVPKTNQPPFDPVSRQLFRLRHGTYVER